MNNIEEKILNAIEPLINPVVHYILHKNNLFQEIVQDVLVTPEWQEITSPIPLKIKKQCQMISLSIECLEDSKKDWSWKLADGTIIRPEVHIIDEFGNSYNLKGGHAGVRPSEENENQLIASSIGFSSYPNKLPKDRNYTKIRIRNEQPFLCPEIYWRDYNLK